MDDEELARSLGEDGRDGGPALRTAASCCFAAGLLLLLPRQYASAAGCWLLALCFELAHQLKQRREARAKPSVEPKNQIGSET